MGKTYIMLDSGAWEAFREAERARKQGIDIDQKTLIDIDAYIDFIKTHEHLVDYYFNLDVVGEGEPSYRNSCCMRLKGLDPIPVWHAYTDINLLYRHRDDGARYIGFGGIANEHIRRRREFFRWLWDIHRGGYDWASVRFHGLGETSAPLLAEFPFTSVDSTSWVYNGGRYGKILVPRKSPLHNCYDFSKPPYHVSLTTRAASRPDHKDNLVTYKWRQVMERIEEKGFHLGKGEPGYPDYEPGLCNDGTLRDLFNAIYHAELGLALGVPIFFAGSFTALGNLEVERRLQQAVYDVGSDYYRLVSFSSDQARVEKISRTILGLKS